MIFSTMQELGHKVEAVYNTALGANDEKMPRRGILSRACWKAGFPIDYMGINKSVIQKFSSAGYDILWLSKPLELRSSTVACIKKNFPDVKIVFYSEDDMYARHNQSRHFRASIGLYDIIFTTKSYNCLPGELPSLGAKRVVFVDKSFDRNRHRPIRLNSDEPVELGAEVGFIGSFEHDRAEKMLYLAKNGINVRVWGAGWPKKWINRHPLLKVENKPLLGDDYIKGICAIDINLGFLRKSNRDLQTDRTMEIPACGAFMLAERTDEHMRLFEEGREAEFFKDAGELLAKTRYYKDNYEQRSQIAAAGRARCLKSGYSFHDRLPGMLSCVMKQH